MNVFKRLAAGLCALFFLGGAAPTDRESEGAAFAADATAESVVADFLRENRLEEKTILLGYRNTVTGEEYYLRGDEYLYPASMYKLALCMHYARQVADGVLSWEEKMDGLSLDKLVEGTLEWSDNQYAGTLLTGITPHFEDYRRVMAPFYGLDPLDLPKEYLKRGENTPRQILFNLQLLYDYPERFPRVTDYLLQASPGEYFLHDPQPWPVAHKYGLMDGDGTVVNDCAIVYTRSPFLLVVFTRNVTEPIPMMSRLLTRLGEYTEFDTDRRAGPTPSPAPAPTAAPTPSPLPTAVPAAEPSEPTERDRTAGQKIAAAGGLAGAAALIFYYLIVRRKRE